MNIMDTTPSKLATRQKLCISALLAWSLSNPNSVAPPPVVGELVASGTSRDPTTRLLPPVSRLTEIPETVTPDPPGMRVEPSITTPDGWAVKVKRPMVNMLGAEVCAGRLIVDVPMISISESFPAFKLICVPEILAPGPPGRRVVPSIMIAEDSEVKVKPPAVSMLGAEVWAGRLMVDVPTISTPESFQALRLIRVPESVVAGPPGTRVVASTTTAGDSAVKVSPPAVKTFEASDLGGRSMLENPMISAPEGAKETGVPERVIAAPPGRRVEPASSKPVESAVNVWPPTVKVFDEDVGAGRLVLELPMNNAPDGLRETGVPETVIAIPPSTSFEPASTNPARLAVMV
ncbi:hypothetical protein MMC29_002517 [Sticta canariensis]|nr:hypothetical protein [Sticta canariensis]